MDPRDDALGFISHTAPHRKPDQPLTEAVGERKRAGRASKASPRLARMQRDVVKWSADAVLTQGGNQRIAAIAIGQQKIIEMPVVLAMRGNTGTPDSDVPRLNVGKRRMIALPNHAPIPCDSLRLVELCPQEGGNEFARQIGRAKIGPGVFVDETQQKARTGGALLPNYLGALGEIGVVGDQRAPSPLTTFLEAWKLKQATSPSVPAGLPR